MKNTYSPHLGWISLWWSLIKSNFFENSLLPQIDYSRKVKTSLKWIRFSNFILVLNFSCCCPLCHLEIVFSSLPFPVFNNSEEKSRPRINWCSSWNELVLELRVTSLLLFSTTEQKKRSSRHLFQTKISLFLYKRTSTKAAWLTIISRLSICVVQAIVFQKIEPICVSFQVFEVLSVHFDLYSFLNWFNSRTNYRFKPSVIRFFLKPVITAESVHFALYHAFHHVINIQVLDFMWWMEG